MAIDPRLIEVVNEQMAAVLRSKSGAERLKIAAGMFAAARRILTSQLASEHPDWDERRLPAEVARRLAHRAE
jgi:hypothetical protein